MGVQGLWDVLSKARQSRSLAHLAVIDGFETNTSGRRAYRVGIDASIWYQHAMHIPKKGANPELRLLFFRLLKLAELPFIPLFVFDGRERPQMKRGSKKGKSGSHALTSEFKKLLDVFGMEWRMALGEAEAELAYLNRVSVIDAVLTDDVDTLIFGAKTIMRNASLNLTGNRANPATNANGKRSEYHVMTFSSESIRTHPDIQMSRGGLILFALVSGGDYDNGLKNFGPQIAHCLARLGFGDQLLRQYEQCQGQGMEAFLTRWRADMNTELHTNAHNLLRSKMPALSVPPTFPDMNVLRYYINPVCSVSAGRQGGGNLRDSGELSIPRIATFCEDHFDEWGYRSAIIKRFRDIMWNAAVMRVLRRAALEADEKEATKRIAAGRTDTTIRGPLEPPVAEEVGTTACLIKKYLCPTEVDRRAAAFVRRDDPPPHKPETLSDNNPLIRKIVGTRRHVSTDNILEYRVEIDPTQLVRLAELGIKGKHREPQGGHRDENVPDYDDLLPVSSQGGSQPKKAGPKNPPPEPCSVMRSWVAASIMRQVHPRLVKEFESAEAAKQARKIGGKRKRQ
ncbi:PIN domain-like protein, partial [Rhodofomes roseus]